MDLLNVQPTCSLPLNPAALNSASFNPATLQRDFGSLNTESCGFELHRTDPNGFVIAVEKTLAAQHDVTRAAELKALRMAKGGLQEMLQKVARGGDASTPDSNSPPG